MNEVELYDNLAEAYDLLISWGRRLRRERAFFVRVFRENRVRRILDTAAGTGMHAIAFHNWGYHVVGADLSTAMVEKARRNAGDLDLEFVQAGFTDPDKIGGMFDAVTCLGNSLPHVLTDDELERSLSSMRDSLLPGGVLIIHSNNYDRVVGRQERFMPLAQARRKGQEYLFMRFFDFHGDLLTFNVISMTKQAGEWRMFPDSSTHRALTRDLLAGMLEKLGFVEIEVYGDFARGEFEPLESDNLIVVAKKPHTRESRPTGETIAAIDRIPIRDNGEKLVDVAEAIPGILTREDSMLSRESVVEMIRSARESLPDGYNLMVKTTYRSLERQRELYEGFYEQLAEQHPEWPASQLRREINKFLAPPDAKHPPGHSTGGAVDLTIVGPDGEELDMTSTIDPVENHMLTFPTYSKLITPRAAGNRQMLMDAMIRAGFSNYPGEWWHFSYGDSAWAVRVGAPFAPYGAAPE